AERLDLTDALAVSDNEYFRSLGARVGAERILDYAGRLGLGEQTGINYEGETAGRLPAAQTVASAARLGFGEGVEVTPVQLGLLASYAPADDPRLAVVVLTSGAGESGAVAAQIAGSIYKALRGRL